MQNNDQNEGGKVIDFNPMTPELEPTLRKFSKKMEGDKPLTSSQKAEKHAKLVAPEIMANIRKHAAEKARVEAVQGLVHDAMESFLYKWNDNPVNDGCQIEIRLTPTSAPAENGMFQFCLALEVKKDGIWRVLCRVGQYAFGGDERTMAILTTDLYRAMFVEIAHSGMLVALAASDQRDHKQYGKTQQSSEITN